MMSRTARYKIGYALAVAAAAAFVFLLLRSTGLNQSMASALAAFVLIIPGRVQGMFYRNLFRGRALLDQHRELEALDHFQGFLADVRERPWLKRLIWLSWSVYTPNVEAMALNNIGAAALALGRIDESESALSEALALDRDYPLPHFNIAVLEEMRSNRMLAETALTEAERLGYDGGTIDAVVNRAQSVLARAEGRGVKAA